jgi:acyl-CoA thioesterase-2
VDFATMMDLEPRGIDAWVGVGPRYPWGGLYGGQIVAQALQAAALTVDPRFLPHSLHAYFIRRGDHTQPVRFEVDRVRDGRSFVTRAVVARQSMGAILNMSASFQVAEAAVEVQTAAQPPDVPGPDELKSEGWSEIFDRRLAPESVRGRADGWLRTRQPVGDDPVRQACALAYLSDDLPTDAVASLHPATGVGDEFHTRFFSASLDHAIWFHRPFEAARWMAQSFTCHGLMGSRGLTLGHVFTDDGIHVATVTQEVLFREVRDRPA